jgi:phosphomannomutase
MEPDRAQVVFEGLKTKALAMGGQVSGADGVRAVFKEGWGIARLSVTEPVLSCRFEAENLSKLKGLAEEWLRDFPEILKPVAARISSLRETS